MSVDQIDVVDMISVDRATREVVLTISDHLEWHNTIEHQHVLQQKLNRYLAFVESGEILQKYPDAQGRSVVINVVFKFEPDKEGDLFLVRAGEVIRSAGFNFRHNLWVAPTVSES